MSIFEFWNGRWYFKSDHFLLILFSFFFFFLSGFVISWLEYKQIFFSNFFSLICLFHEIIILHLNLSAEMFFGKLPVAYAASLPSDVVPGKAKSWYSLTLMFLFDVFTQLPHQEDSTQGQFFNGVQLVRIPFFFSKLKNPECPTFYP